MPSLRLVRFFDRLNRSHDLARRGCGGVPAALADRERPADAWFDPYGEFRNRFSRSVPFPAGAVRGEVPLPPGWAHWDRLAQQTDPKALFAWQEKPGFIPVWAWGFQGAQREELPGPVVPPMPLVPALGETPGLYGPFRRRRNHQACAFDEVWILADLEPVARRIHAERTAWAKHPDRLQDRHDLMWVSDIPWLRSLQRNLAPVVHDLPGRLQIVVSTVDPTQGRRVWDAYHIDTAGLVPRLRRAWSRRARRASPLRAPLEWAGWALGLRRDFILDVLLGSGGVMARMGRDARDLADRYAKGWLPPDLEILRDWIRDMREGGWAQAHAARLALAERLGRTSADGGPVLDITDGPEMRVRYHPGAARWGSMMPLGEDERGVLATLWRDVADRRLTTRPTEIAEALRYHNYRVELRQNRGIQGLLRRMWTKQKAPMERALDWNDSNLYLEAAPDGTRRLAARLAEPWNTEPHKECFGPQTPDYFRRSFMENLLSGLASDALALPGAVVRVALLPVEMLLLLLRPRLDGLRRGAGTALKSVAVGLAVLVALSVLCLVPILMILAR